MRPTKRGLRYASAAALVGAVAAVTATAALAAPSGTVTETINVGVRSLTVSPTAVNLCTPASPLTFPNGQCQSPQVVITNGPAGGHIDVSGANASPSDGSGNGWLLCSPEPGATTACVGNPQAGFPGPDQYIEQTQASGLLPNVEGVFITGALQCDLAVGGVGGPGANCNSSPGQLIDENLGMMGPSSSSDQSSTFSTVVSWTAAP